MERISFTKIALLFLLFLCQQINAQDFIIKKDGTEIKAKVSEITSLEVKYKRSDNIDGPSYVIAITEISNIKYQNGTTESFAKNNNENSKIAPDQTIITGIQEGIVKTKYPTGELFCETPYLNGKINGIQKLYYKSGSIISETPFVDGFANGLSKVYYKSGKLKDEIQYVNGNITGICSFGGRDYKPYFSKSIFLNNKSYYKNGNLKWDIPQSNGIINGTVKIYWEGGSIAIEAPFINNLENGQWKMYMKNTGALGFVFNYIDGENQTPYRNNGNDWAAVVQGLQQGIAYENMLNNTNSQTVNAYTQVAVNNYTKPTEEALKSNNEILANSTVINTSNTNNSQINSESSAINSGNNNFNKNAGAAKKCADDTQNSWKLTNEYKNYIYNPGCNKMAYISQKKLAEMLLQNCRQYLPQSEIDGFNKTISTLQTTINGMEDCRTF